MSKKTTKAQAVDARLFQQIQPHGGITFADPSYTRMGDGYCRCLHIYGLPNTLDRHWLTRIFTVSGCICSFDVATEDMAAVKRSINRSIGEEGARAYDAKDYNALYDAQKRQAELQQLYDELERMGEVMKICDFRIFLQAQMLAELEEKTKELQDNLDASGYKNTVLLGEQKTEWQSLYEPFAVTHAKPVTMKGLSLTARQLAEGYPFDYSDLLDEQGALLGFTDMGGAVVFDLFSKTVKRKHYNAAVCGDMGSGKSTLLKKLFKQNASIGNYIRCFDVSGEFSALTLEFGGKIIRCSGSDGMLNPLEILRSGEDDYASYARHISKLQAFFRCINPSMSDQLLQELANYLREFYAGFDLVPADAFFRTAPGFTTAMYSFFSVAEFAGRTIGGAVRYRYSLPERKRFGFLFGVYQTYELMDACLLWLPYPLMLVNRAVCGFLGIQSATIRQAAVQRYIPDRLRARLNAYESMLCTAAGAVLSLAIGALGEVLDYRLCMTICGLIAMAVCWLTVFLRRRQVQLVLTDRPGEAQPDTPQ